MANITKPEPKTGQESVELWMERLHGALQARQNDPNGDRQWKRNLKLALGNHWRDLGQEPDSEVPRNRITVNLIGATIQDLVPFLIRRNPEFHAKPTKEGPENVLSAQKQSALLNYKWRQHRMNDVMTRAVIDGLVFGHGLVKTGFKLELDDSVNVSREGRINYEDFVVGESPWIKRVNPFHFVFDPHAPDQDLHSARWAAEIIFRPVRDVLADARYSRSVISDIKSGKESPMTRESFLSEISNRDAPSFSSLASGHERDLDSLMVLWELWDKKFQKRYVFAEGILRPLIEEAWPHEYLVGFPYEMLEFVRLPNERYAYGIPKHVEDQQFELNRIRTKQFIHHRRFNRKFQAPKNALDNSEALKLQTDEDGSIIFFDGVAGDNPIVPIPDGAMSIDTDRTENAIKQDIREMLGTDELFRGGNLPSRTSATEVNRRTQIQGLKLEGRIQAVDNFFERVGTQVLKHLQANIGMSQVVRIIGSPIVEFAEISPEDIKGAFDLEIESVSAERHDPVMERQQRIQMLQILLGAIEVLQGRVDYAEALRWVMESFDKKDLSRFFPDLAQQAGGLGAPGTPGIPGESGPPGLGTSIPDPGRQAVGRTGQAPGAGALGQVLGALSGGDRRGQA